MDEELLVRLTGEASDYIKMLNDAQSKTESVGSTISTALDETSSQSISSLENVAETVNEYADQIEVAADGIDELSDAQEDASDNASTLADKLDSAAEALGDIGSAANDVAEAISKVAGGLEFWDSFEAFAEAEASEIKLRAAMEANGREVESLMDDYKEFADEIQRVSTTEGDLAIALLQQAESLGVTGEAAKRAVKSAVAMQNAFGVAAESAIRMTTELENGKTTMLARYIPALRGIKDGAEAAAIAQEYLAKAHKVTEANAQTAAGQIEQLNNAWGDFKEEVGGVIAQVLKPLVSILKEVVSFFQELPQPVKIAIAGLLTLVTVIGAVSAVSATVIVAVKGVIAVLGTYVTATRAAIAITIAWKAVLIGGVAYAFYEVGKAISGTDESLEKFNNTVKDSQELNDKWAENFSKNTAKITEELDKITNPTRKKLAIESQLHTAQIELRGYENMVSSAAKQVEELNTRWNRWTGNKELELANHNLEDYRRKLELSKSWADKLSNSLKNLGSKRTTEDIQKDIEEFIESLKKQEQEIGRTSNQLKLYQFQLDKASDAALNAAKNQMEFNRVLSGMVSVQDMANASLERMREELHSINNTPIDAEISKMSAALQRLVIASTKVDQTGEQFFKLEAQIKSARQAIEVFRIESKKINEMKEAELFRKKGLDLITKHKTAVENYNDEIVNLNLLLEKGIIDQYTYAKSWEEAKNKLDSATKSTDKLKESLQMLNAVEFGSAEAEQRIEEFNNKLREQLRQIKEQSKAQRGVLNPLNMPSPIEMKFDLPRMIEQFKQLETGKVKERMEQVPAFDRNITNVQSNVTAGSSADNTVMTDRKEMIKFLSSIDGTLKNISGKPGVTLGTVNIQNT